MVNITHSISLRCIEKELQKEYTIELKYLLIKYEKIKPTFLKKQRLINGINHEKMYI